LFGAVPHQLDPSRPLKKCEEAKVSPVSNDGKGKEDCTLTISNFDTQGFSNQGEQSAGELDSSAIGDRHIHPNETLVRQSVWTLSAEANRWRHVPQHFVHVGVMNSATESN
jgi:hypothetical protein